MDEIMAAMVLTSLSCSPVIQSPTQREPLPYGSLEMECGGGELSDSGSSGYWSWEHGSVSPAPSPSVTETDCSMGQVVDEGLHMELGPQDELETRSCTISSRGAYRCLWPSCSKVLTSRLGMKRHIRILHLRGSEQSHREEDFYYTKVSSEEEEEEATSPTPSLSFNSGPWSPCSSAPNQPASQEAKPSSSALSQSAPSSVWQIHTEHLYQACVSEEVITSPDSSSSSCDWTSVRLQLKPQVSRSRSVSVGEPWLQQNSTPTRSHTMSASPSRGHCTARKGRCEAKKCRKVYGVERRNQWCTACRWKKACQRFPD